MPRPAAQRVTRSRPLPKAKLSPTPPSWTYRAGVSSLATGGAGFTLALAGALVTYKANQTLSDACDSDGRCPEHEASTVRRYRWGARLTNAGLYLGVLGTAAGVSLLLLDSRNENSLTLSLSPEAVQLETTF